MLLLYVLLSCLQYQLVALVVMMCLGFFFFKQKTAYELRISDWSSDVCSSDLSAHCCRGCRAGRGRAVSSSCRRDDDSALRGRARRRRNSPGCGRKDRKSVV